MKLCLFTRYLTALAIALTVPALLIGCARFPSGATPTTFREMSFQISFHAPIDDNKYYFVAVDVTGGGEGPRPVFPDPNIPTGEEWVTGSATHYVQYHARQYIVYKITNLHPFESVPIGVPLRSVLPDIGGSSLSFTLDLDSIEATGDSVDINIFALNQLSPDGRLLDGLGLRAADFLNLDINTDRVFRNSELLTPESAGDVLNQNVIPQDEGDLTNPIDITDWVITIDV